MVKVEKGILQHLECNHILGLKVQFSVRVISGCSWVIDSIPSTEESLRTLARAMLPADGLDDVKDASDPSVIQQQCVIQ